MNTNILLAKPVLNQAAVLMNDPNRTVYTYTVLIPYLNLAMQELQEEFQLNNIAVTDESSAPIEIPSGTEHVRFQGPPPNLPGDLIEPIRLWERPRNVNPYVEMSKRAFIPHLLEGVQISQLVYWVWQKQELRFLPANQNIDIKIDYTRNLFYPVDDENSPINVINAQTFLEYRTAALTSEFVEHNEERANACNQGAATAADRSMGISIKGKQGMMTRRKPFRIGWKRRGFIR